MSPCVTDFYNVCSVFCVRAGVLYMCAVHVCCTYACSIAGRSNSCTIILCMTFSFLLFAANISTCAFLWPSVLTPFLAHSFTMLLFTAGCGVVCCTWCYAALHCVVRVTACGSSYAASGLRGFYRGVSVILLRSIPTNAAGFWCLRATQRLVFEDDLET